MDDTLVPVQRYSLHAIMLVCGHVVIYQAYQQLWCPFCGKYIRRHGRPERVNLDD